MCIYVYFVCVCGDVCMFGGDGFYFNLFEMLYSNLKNYKNIKARIAISQITSTSYQTDGKSRIFSAWN